MSRRFELIAMVWPDRRMTVAEFEAHVRAHHGVPPTLHRMELRDLTGPLGVFECWASWCGERRHASERVHVRTAAGTVVHTFDVVPPEPSAASGLVMDSAACRGAEWGDL